MTKPGENPECLAQTCASISAAQFWKLKAALTAVEWAQERARAVVAPSQAVLAEAMRQAGLDPSGQYALDEATESVRRVDTEAEA